MEGEKYSEDALNRFRDTGRKEVCVRESVCVCVCVHMRWRNRRGSLAFEQCDFCSTVTNLAQQENQFGPVCAFLAPGENPNSKARPG